jgi:hypothetical protein
MGMRVSWVSFLQLSKSHALSKLGLLDTLEEDEYFESDIVCAELKTGDSLVFFNDYLGTERLDLANLSTNGSLIAVNVHETTMSVKVTLWTNGAQVWSIIHEGHLSIDHLVTDGDLPSVFDAIYALKVAEQEGVTDCDFYFDIPVDVAKALCGFRHDEFDLEAFVSSPTIAMSTGSNLH